MIWISIWVHFMRHHMWDTIVVLEEDNHSLPHYPKCDMFFIWRELNKNHQATSMYAWGDYTIGRPRTGWTVSIRGTLPPNPPSPPPGFSQYLPGLLPTVIT